MSERSELSPKDLQIMKEALEAARAQLNLAPQKTPDAEAIKAVGPILGPNPEVVRFLQEVRKNRSTIDFRPGEI